MKPASEGQYARLRHAHQQGDEDGHDEVRHVTVDRAALRAADAASFISN
jgi:hypothetical protein